VWRVSDRAFFLTSAQLTALLPQERGQALYDRLVIFRRVSCDTSKCSDASDSNCQLVVTELINCTGEAVGDVPFLIQLKLAEGEVDAEEENGAPDPLQQGGAHIVLKREPLIHKLLAFDWISYFPQ